MSFKNVSEIIKLPEEIDKKYGSEDLKLGDWIQRKIEKNRISTIVNYLKTQNQHFFNTIIVGIFDGSPSWQDINIKNPIIDEIIDDSTIEYFNRTFGILSLSGSESMFAIDGQHRAISIREAVKQDKSLENDEISVIFVAHHDTEDGKVRTRRLFSTLNRYAKPVSESEIIALSEDNNCAIITRAFIDNFSLLKGKILINKNRSISVENTSAFTNIMVLYDIVLKLLTDVSIHGIKVSGYSKHSYTTTRIDDKNLEEDYKICEKYLTKVLTSIPSVKSFLKSGKVDRKEKSTNLIFRPIGQNIYFDVFRVALDFNKEQNAINYFKKDNFNLANECWKKVFWDDETNSISPEKSKQRYATLLILEKIGVKINRTKKDIEIYNNYNISLKDI